MQAQPSVIVLKSGPNILVRFVWWLLIGWWASGFVIALAWVCLALVVTIPAGIWLINHLPSVLTLRPRTQTWTLGQDAEGRIVTARHGRPQVFWLWRGLWFVVVGWWASALWMAAAWLVQFTVVGLPIAMLMFNRTPFVANLYRY